MKKILSHLRKNWFIYGVGALFSIGVVQEQGWVDFDPMFKAAGLGIDYAMKVKDQILIWAGSGYAVIRTGKAVLYPAYAEYLSTKKMISEKDSVAKEIEAKAKQELAIATNNAYEVDKSKVLQLEKQNELLESILKDQKSLPELLEELKKSVINTVEEFKDEETEL
jgi:hypothetical protein